MKGEKFIEQKDLDGVEILTDNGYVPVVSVLKTVDMGVWMVKAGRFCLHCAGEHIVIMADGSERFVRELAVGDLIRSEDGDVAVEAVADCGNEEAMYDLIVGSDEHVYFADGILSHNTTTSMAYLLHCAVFRSHSTIAILSNKLETSVEVMDRIKFAFEQLPWFLRPGVVTWNKQRIEFDNGTKVFAAATSSSSVRGRSVNVVFIDEFAHIDNDIAFYESTYPVISSGKNTQVIITSTPKGLNLFYHLWSNAMEGRNEFKTLAYDWSVVPGRDEKWKEETIANTSPVQFAQEFECVHGDTMVEVYDTVEDKYRHVKMSVLFDMVNE